MENDLKAYFDAIKQGDVERVRTVIASNKQVLKQKSREAVKYPPEDEMDAIKFLGGFTGELSGLQLSLFLGQDDIAKEIVQASFTDDLNITYGLDNTALHLAALLGAVDLVKLLLERGANSDVTNRKGFKALDVVDSEEVRRVFAVAH